MQFLFYSVLHVIKHTKISRCNAYLLRSFRIIIPITTHTHKKPNPPNLRTPCWPQSLISSLTGIYANGAIWNAPLSIKTFVQHRIYQKTRQANSFINWADMEIHRDKLQILRDNVSSTAGILGQQCSEGSCCRYHGGLFPSFIVCPAINDAQWFTRNHPPCSVCTIVCI